MPLQNLIILYPLLMRLPVKQSKGPVLKRYESLSERYELYLPEKALHGRCFLRFWLTGLFGFFFSSSRSIGLRGFDFQRLGSTPLRSCAWAGVRLSQLAWGRMLYRSASVIFSKPPAYPSILPYFLYLRTPNF